MIRQVMAATVGRISKRGLTILVDQIVSSASNVLVLLVAARTLALGSLSSLALALLACTTVVGLQRAALLAPALAAQRTHGRGVLPVTWLFRSLLPGMVLSGALLFLATRDLAEGRNQTWAFVTLGMVVVMAQDVARYSLLTRDRAVGTLAMDGTWLVVTSGLLVLAVSNQRLDVQATLLSWQFGALASLPVALFFTARGTSGNIEGISFSETWKLGRWSLTDAALSSVALLAPMFIAGLVVGSDSAGIYRILQTALTPLNTINSVLVTKFGLDAWKLRTSNSLRIMRLDVNRVTRVLVPMATALALVGQPIILWIAGVSLRAALIPMAVVTFSAILGAWSSARIAAAQALGLQRIGALTRIAGVTVAGLVAAWALTSWPVSLGDPIAITLVASAIVTFAGWRYAYEKGLASHG